MQNLHRKRTLQVDDQLEQSRTKVQRLENILQQTNVSLFQLKIKYK